MGYASKRINRDPYPWRHDHDELCDASRMSGRHLPRSATKETQEDQHDPRPEYDNNYNPALLEVREALEKTPAGSEKSMLNIKLMGLKWDIEDHEGSWRRYTPETISYMYHARKVLSRLTELMEE